LLTDDDLYLFNEGRHYRLYGVLGGHLDADGAEFAVWAPNAEEVSVIGQFNGWNPDRHRLQPRASSGIWTGRVPGARRGHQYKYRIRSRLDGYVVDKADPVGFFCDQPPGNASVLWDHGFDWSDVTWMRERGARFAREAPVSIYEVHLGSWLRGADGRQLTYGELAPRLADHVAGLGFSHVELMPVMEHPFFGSWGYQVTGYFAPTSRWGDPQGLMHLIDVLHGCGIGVILDWVPAHFPTDPHGLGYFDGTHLYEHADPRKGFHPDWTSFIPNFGRLEVQAFFISSALFWLDRYHADGLRVDGVASMLYLDYSRGSGEWIPNEDGSNHNRDAIDFIRRFNEVVYREYPDVQTIAEESTAWAGVSRPTSMGGLGFGYKWDMGWMHDTLKYLAHDPIHRRHHHDEITFRAIYTYTENYVLPLSHDEVVHGKGSLLDKMPGDHWQKKANLRLLYGYQWAQPGKKMIFMGGELGVWSEWRHDGALDWPIAEHPDHAAILRYVAALNALYRAEPALHRRDVEPGGFEWIEGGARDDSMLAFLRRGDAGDRPVLVVCNFTPVTRDGFRVGVPQPGRWRELLSSDDQAYGGSGKINPAPIASDAQEWNGRPQSIAVTLPPLGCAFFAPEP
jgi:1,4-alpha-glucan branching enzyme